MTPTRERLLRFEVPFAALGAVLVASAFVFSVAGIPRWIPPALIVRAGVPSPFTGMTRSFVALASGDITAAFAWHPLGPLLFSICVVLPALVAVWWTRDRRWAPPRTTWVVAALVVTGAWARQIAVLG